MASDAGIRPTRLPKASDVLADDLRRMILGQRLAEGTQLPSEAELVEELDLSRATVREALRILEENGLISVKRGPRGGIRVQHPDAANVARSLTMVLGLTDTTIGHLLDARMVLEPAVAGLAATHATDEQRGRMRALASHDETVGEQIDFHVAVATSTGNAVLGILGAALHELVRFHVLAEQLGREDRALTARAHERITDAIEANDADGAARAMRRHLEVFAQRIRERGRLEQPVVPASRWDTERRTVSVLAAAARARTPIADLDSPTTRGSAS